MSRSVVSLVLVNELLPTIEALEAFLQVLEFLVGKYQIVGQCDTQ